MKRDRLKDAVYYHCILSSKQLYSEITPQFFEGSPLQYIYELARDYTMRYGQAPTESDMYAQVDRLDMVDEEKNLKYDKDRIHMLYTRADEVALYGHDALEDEITSISKWSMLQECLGQAATEFRLMDDQISPENIDQAIDKIYAAISDRHLPSFDNNDNPIVDFWDPTTHNSENIEHWKTGYQFLDECLDGGYWPGSLHLLLGAPKVGKSMWLCNLAVKSSLAGNDTLYVTLEMSASMVNGRLMPNIADIPNLTYKRIRNDANEVGRYLSSARKKNPVTPGRLDIINFPTNTLSAEHLAERILEEEEKRSTPDKPFKYRNIFIDYLSIMISSLKDKSNMYLDGKRKAEEVRSQAQINNWCIVSAVQTNRAQYGSSDIDETQVSESSGYNATVDSMFGIVQDEVMRGAGLYRLKTIYDRVAPCQGNIQDFKFERDYLRIKQIGETYVDNGTMAAKKYAEASAKVQTASLETHGLSGSIARNSANNVTSGVPVMPNQEQSGPEIQFEQQQPPSNSMDDDNGADPLYGKKEESQNQGWLYNTPDEYGGFPAQQPAPPNPQAAYAVPPAPVINTPTYASEQNSTDTSTIPEVKRAMAINPGVPPMPAAVQKRH